jgi:two-component sensor histidine kinase
VAGTASVIDSDRIRILAAEHPAFRGLLVKYDRFDLIETDFVGVRCGGKSRFGSQVCGEHGLVGFAEADHRIANNRASLSGVIRFQRNAISKSGKTFAPEDVCSLLDDIGARIEVTAKLHKSLALIGDSNGVNLGDFVEEISEMIAALGPKGNMELRFDNRCDGYIDPRHALHAALITAELLTNASKYAHPSGLIVKVYSLDEVRSKIGSTHKSGFGRQVCGTGNREAPEENEPERWAPVPDLIRIN